MTSTSSVQPPRSSAGTVALPLAGCVLLGVAALLEPDWVDTSGPDSTGAALRPSLDWLAANTAAGWTASLLTALALLLLAGWAALLGRLAVKRGRRLARSGAVLAAVCLLLAAAGNVAVGAVRIALTQPDIAVGNGAAAYGGVVTGDSFSVLFAPGILIQPLAGIVLLIGLLRARVLPWWASVPASVAVAAASALPLGRLGGAIVLLALTLPAVARLLGRQGRRSVQLDPAAA